jgi:acyl-CoA reductase-like NAD-dependent aldehyde dehydrogenase
MRAFGAGTWSRAAPRHRKNVLRAFSELVRDHTDELALLITLDMGKPIREALREVDSCVRHIAFYAEAVDKVYGEVGPSAETTFAFATREPVGVVAAVVPWNFPLLMPVWKLAPALAAGNSVVVKPAEQAPLAALRMASLATEAGLPDGVLSVVPGLGEDAGRALGLHMDVASLGFTGSTEVGRMFLRYAGESNLKMVWLECGGKSPNIVLADAPDLDLAVATTAEAIFHNGGQVCNAGSRLLIESPIHDEFVAALLRERERWTPQDPLLDGAYMGALVDEGQMERVLGYIDVGREEGAEIAGGGRRVLAETGGYYVEPTVFVGVQDSMRIAREEIFGPVLSTVALDDVDALVRSANDTIYGLAAAVWTSDLSRAHRVARRLEAGSVYVNCYDRGDNSLPFGGFKQSGYGVDRSLHAMEKYTRMKMTWIEL